MEEPRTSPPAADDQALLERVRAGDSEALEALLERYEAPLFRFSMRMCRDREDAREILQESLLAAARSIGEFRGDAALSTWLFTIARSFCIKYRRKPRPTDSAVADEQVTAMEDPRPAPDERVADRELLAAVERAIETLDPGYREVLLLRDVEGLTAPEVASALEMSVSQVKSRLHRARVALREELSPLLAELHPPPDGPVPGCPDIAETFSRFLEDEISADLCAEMQSHVDSCGHCQSTCDSLKHTLAVCNAVPAPEVPQDIQQAVRAEIRKLSRG
ncbi:MAG: sigma-70 family RNA polymerase sigma factor [Myxococcales bacterium]|nr:sigma-70 family RNA polymerase sigma factor [Myxococcales bacterium]